MSGCASFGGSGPAGIADALQSVDCLATEATSASFGRLFGEHGAFQGALTILLTIYVAILAVNLLTGRSGFRVSLLTPKMINLGLVLTFITSWVAYQSVVWNLAIGGPDEVASVLVGSKGSATLLFAQRLDQFFDAITAAAEAIPAAQPASSGLASPANILSLSAIMLLLGTVGVLVVCRLALAALLILGPIFIVLALFASTRGLFEGWLKSVVTFALVPLLTVVIGSGALIALEPMVASLNSGGAEISLHTAVSVLVASVVYVSLMMVAFKVAGTLTRSWRLGKSGEAHRQSDSHSTSESRQMSSSHHMSQQTSENPISDRVRTTVASLSAYREAGRRPDATMLSLRSQWSPAELTALPLQNGASRHDANLEFRMKGPVGKLPREMVR